MGAVDGPARSVIMGVKLFERLRGGVVLTPVGETSHRRSESVEQQINAIEREAARSEMEVEGLRTGRMG